MSVKTMERSLEHARFYSDPSVAKWIKRSLDDHDDERGAGSETVLRRLYEFAKRYSLTAVDLIPVLEILHTDGKTWAVVNSSKP